MRAPSYGKVRWKWRRKRRGVQLCLEEDNLRNTTGTMESIRSELLCQKDAFGRCFICPSLDSKLELAKATSWGRGIRSDFPFPTGIWSYRLTSKRSKTLLISLSAVSGVGSYLCRREGHSELSSPCPPWYRTSDATAEGPGCRVLLYTCPNTLLWTSSNQLLCRENTAPNLTEPERPAWQS